LPRELRSLAGVTTEPQSLYDRVGGRPFFIELATRFYEGVAVDPLLVAMYPSDLEAAREHLTLFLVQYFGGPRDYEATRGEPRLRLRHLPFAIDRAARDAWVARMDAAIESTAARPEVAEELRAYFASTATFLINRGLTIVGS
jgi:hemoglobin